jgi:hypothetical protein
MIALNGVSISAMTGIELPFLPQFPMETWNFRIVHIAGALALGSCCFGPPFATTPPARTPAVSLLAPLLLHPGADRGWTAMGFPH